MTVTILTGDCRDLLRTLPEASVHACVTSPPYFGLRDYGVDGQIGLEATPDEFVAELVAVFREVRRVLREDGTLWLNLGDSYNSGASGGLSGSTLGGGKTNQSNSNRSVSKRKNGKVSGLKPKDLIGIPWRVAFALQADGWYLRQDIIWSKPNPMPESVRDRCTKAHEYLFLLSKSERYYFDQAAISEEMEPSSVARLAQNVEAQVGSERVPGKTNGTMRAVGGSRRNSFARETKASAGKHGQTAQHRADREEIDYTGRRNRRSVWTVATQPFKEAHFATFPPELIEPCIAAGAPSGGTVLDPFGGAGTTGLVAETLGRDSILIEMNPEYARMAHRRTMQRGLTLPEQAA